MVRAMVAMVDKNNHHHDFRGLVHDYPLSVLWLGAGFLTSMFITIMEAVR